MTPANFRDLTGLRFGRLVVLGRAPSGAHWRVKWRCQCDCGNEVVADGGNLKSGHTSSCGCVARETVATRSKTHGESNTRLYYVWGGVLRRCENPKTPEYKYYGARGISVCAEWHEYSVFRDWMFANGYDPAAPRGVCTIDRIDPDGDYAPANCRVVDMKTQRRNQRRHARKGGAPDG